MAWLVGCRHGVAWRMLVLAWPVGCRHEQAVGMSQRGSEAVLAWLGCMAGKLWQWQYRWLCWQYCVVSDRDQDSYLAAA